MLDGSRICVSCSAPGALRIAAEKPRVIPDTTAQRLLAALTAMLVLAAIVGIAVLAITQDRSTREPASGAISETAATTETTIGNPRATRWTRIAHDEIVFGDSDRQEMHSVVAGASGLVAVGSDSASGDEDAAVWTSPDGITWARVPQDATVFGGIHNQLMLAATL